MSTEKQELSPLDAMLAQYAANNAPKAPKFTPAKVYDLKNYFNTFIEKEVKSAIKEIRLLPSPNGGSPIDQFHGHKYELDGGWKVAPCLKHENGEACPFCEAREALLATGDANDKELAKKFSPKLIYVAKVIDRKNEDEGVKFWRFNHDYRKEGIFDKIQGTIAGLKKNRDISDPELGRDLSISINRNMNGIPVVSSITPLDSDALTEDEAKKAEWLSDTRTWRDVYAIKNYAFLEIIVRGGVPVWSKELGKLVDKNATPEAPVDDTEDEGTIGLESLKTLTPATGEDEGSDEPDDMPF